MVVKVGINELCQLGLQFQDGVLVLLHLEQRLLKLFVKLFLFFPFPLSLEPNMVIVH